MKYVVCMLRIIMNVMIITGLHLVVMAYFFSKFTVSDQLAGRLCFACYMVGSMWCGIFVGEYWKQKYLLLDLIANLFFGGFVMIGKLLLLPDERLIFMHILRSVFVGTISSLFGNGITLFFRKKC